VGQRTANHWQYYKQTELFGRRGQAMPEKYMQNVVGRKSHFNTKLTAAHLSASCNGCGWAGTLTASSMAGSTSELVLGKSVIAVCC
jgi:hypothetical protein